MAWYELDEWDALGAAGEGVKRVFFLYLHGIVYG